MHGRLLIRVVASNSLVGIRQIAAKTDNDRIHLYFTLVHNAINHSQNFSITFPDKSSHYFGLLFKNWACTFHLFSFATLILCVLSNEISLT